MPGDNRFDLMPIAAIRTKPQVQIKPDFYGEGGTYNPLDAGAGPADDFRPKSRERWPSPTIPEGGTPATFVRQDDYPFDPGAGDQKNAGAVNENPTDLAVRIDQQTRPKQLILAEQVGLPFMPGEGRRYADSGKEPMDPSVISWDQVGVRKSRAGFFDGLNGIRKRPNRPAGLRGLGLEISSPADAAGAVATAAPVGMKAAVSAGGLAPLAVRPKASIFKNPLVLTAIGVGAVAVGYYLWKKSQSKSRR